VLAEGMDRARDVRNFPGIEERVRAVVSHCLGEPASPPRR
jgi:hypothetical protein